MRANLLRTMRVLSFTGALMIAVPLMINAQMSKVYFAGTWALNEMKSSPLQHNYTKMVVQQENNLITATITEKDGKSLVFKYALDGKESINKTDMGDVRSTARLSDDGKLLTISNRSYSSDEETESQEVWSLTDPKTLSVEITTPGGSGDVVSKLVYVKK